MRSRRTIAAPGGLIPLVLLLSGPAHPDAGEAERQFAAFTTGLRSYSASFEQIVYAGDGEREETSRGAFYLQQPDLMRWKYQQPYEQLIVADGRKVWSWDVELEQITVRDQSEAEQQSPLTLLTDPAQLHTAFDVRGIDRQDGILHWLELVPARQESEGELAGFERILVAMGGSLLQVMVLVDDLGQRTEIRFSDIRKNPELPAELFEFTPPEGIDVLEG